MGDGLAPRGAARPRRESSAAAVYGGQNPQRHDEDVYFVQTYRENQGAPERLAGESSRIADRRHSAPQVVHQRHMPVGTQKFHIPRKTKEKLALFQLLSCESREYEDMMTALTSGYLDPASAGCFTYSNPRLVHSETLEKEFVEKRKELKADGRTEKELEESYCFLLSDSSKLQTLCEKGLFVGQSWITVLGNPTKGVYLSRCSDLLQLNPFTPGASGEIIIFKVIKGKVKSIYENMKNLLDPTPRFDSHLSKNISKVTSLMSYRAYELTQHYFYEYSFDELRQRPRQVCPYAVVSFHFKGKDTLLTSKPMAPLRLNSQAAEKSQECAQYTVWSGDLVKDDKVLFQISLRSSSPPFLPHKLPEKLDMKWLMRWDQATRQLPRSLFSYNLYNSSSSQEVVKDGHCCSLLEAVDRNRSTTSVSKLLQELESRAVVLVTPLTERGFLFLLSSVQMALPHERGENWRRSLQALFVFPESRHTKSTPQSSVSSEACSDSVSADSVMPGLNHFVPALHFALGKARTNPPPELSAGVEQQAREYLTGIKDGALRPYPMGQYEPELEQGGRQYPVPKHHRLGLDTCLRPYLCGPALYLLLLSRVKHLVQPLIAKQKRHEPETTGRTQGDQKMQQLIDLVLTCKRNAEKEVQSEMKSGARKRRLEQEQETAQRALKHLKASQELRHLNAPQQQDTSHRDTTEVPSSPGSLTSLIGSVGLKDTDLREEEGSELATKLIALLTNLNQKATDQSLSDPREAAQKESSPFDRIALKLGLPTNCDIDLRKQDDLEEQMGGSVSSQEGFSPSSHSGELNHLRSAHRDRNRDRKRPQRDAPVVCEEEIQLQLQQPEIPWILIPITGLCSERYTHRDTDLPQDPRFQHLVSMTTTPASAPASASFSISTATTVSSLPMIIVPTAPVPLDSPTLYLPSSSPDPSPPASPSQCPSPDPSSPPSHCPSPEPDPGSSPEPEPEPAASPEHGEASNGPLTVGGEAFNDLLTDGGEAFNDPQTEENEEIPVSGDRTEPPESPEIAVQSPAPCSSSAQLSPKASSPPEPTLSDEELPDILSLDPMSPPLLIQDIDSIVDRHLDSFSSDIQCILRNQCIYNYTFPQSPHSTSHPERPTSTFPHGQMSSFSQYVSFYNPSPPVHRYVNSLHKRISGVLSDYENNWTPNRPDSAATATATTTTDLASRVSEFVASIRAANDDRDAPPETGMWQTDSQRELSCVSTSSMDCDESEEAYIDNTRQEIQNDVVCSEDLESDTDISSGRRQVQFSSNHLEISFRNELETHSGSSRDVEDLRERADSSVSPTINSDTSALNTLINQLQPEVFTNLVEIIKDIKRNSQHFYIHFTEQDDYMAQEIRAQLLTQSYIEQSPVSFLSHEENANGKLLVVIKNQDIAAHIHQIPELLSLKRRSSVVFVGVDTAEDMRNHSYQELFVSGGQVISDEMVLNPDFVSHDKLSTLLSVLEKHSSSENLWRWKVHCKTHKKLKEQARFRRDAASLLDVLLAYHKRQIVDFLPYHKCDMSQGCELLDCVMELQGRYSSYRHTVLLTENRLVNSSGVGVIVCGIEEFLQDFNRLVGLNDNNNKQPIRDEPQSTQDHSQSSLIPSVSEQLLPESSLSSIPLHSEQDFEVLHRAISQLRAERQKQLRESQAKDTSGAQGAVSTTIATTEQRPFTPPSDKCSNTEQLTPGRKAVAATLELIHSSLHPSEEDQTTTQPRVQVENQLTIDHKRCPETQLTIDRKRSPETQLTIDCKRNPETQAPVVEPRGSEVPSGSQGSSVPSMPKIPVQYEPANATVRPPSPAPNTSLHQSNTTETTNTSPAESSRTKRRKKQKKNAEEDMASFNPAKKPKLENSKGKQKYLLLANDNMNLINPRLLADPNLWGTVALIREGLLPTGFPIAPINAAKVAEWTTKSRVRRVVDPVPKRCPKGWWPTRITIYDSHERPWAVVAKIDKQTKEITPVFLLLGQYSHSQPPPLYRQYHEDRYDMVMYF